MIFGLAAWCSDSKHLEGVLVSGSDLARKSKLRAGVGGLGVGCQLACTKEVGCVVWSNDW